MAHVSGFRGPYRFKIRALHSTVLWFVGCKPRLDQCCFRGWHIQLEAAPIHSCAQVLAVKLLKGLPGNSEKRSLSLVILGEPGMVELTYVTSNVFIRLACLLLRTASTSSRTEHPLKAAHRRPRDYQTTQRRLYEAIEILTGSGQLDGPRGGERVTILFKQPAKQRHDAKNMPLNLVHMECLCAFYLLKFHKYADSRSGCPC